MSQPVPQHPELVVTAGGTVFTNRWKMVISLVVLVAALGYLGFVAFQSATVYYYTVTELNSLDSMPEAKLVRVSGKLVPSSFHREEGSTVASFTLTDGSQSLRSDHEGVLPDLFFNEHSEIILEGTYSSGDVFQSQNIIVKCPSKYIAVD